MSAATPDQPRRTEGAVSVLRRGLAETPSLRQGLWWTIAMALVAAIGRLLTPILIQQILDRGINGPQGFRPRLVAALCLGAAAVVGVVYVAGRVAFQRMVRSSERALYELRVRTFSRIHELSIAEQTAERRGAFLSRVTNDVDTLSQFLEWSWTIWITSTVMMLATTAVMLVYSWQLTLVVLAVLAPMVGVLRAFQTRLLAAYDVIRTRVGQTMAELSESVLGAAVVRAYGLEERMDRRVKGAIGRQYDAQLVAIRYGAPLFSIAHLFGAVATAAAFAVGVVAGPGWGLSAGDLIAFLFLVALLLDPVNELSETFDQTQTAIAGWRKVLGVLDMPIEVKEPAPGRTLPPGALPVRVEGLSYAYPDDGRLVLRDIDLDLASGTHVAVVGETGSGKTTLARLLCRLADPTEGRILLGGVDLRELAPAARRAAIRMVPQDGFLFDATVGENVRIGRPGAGADDVRAAFADLGLAWWVERLPAELDSQAGQRGEQLSAGERQLVALARAQIAGGSDNGAGPGLLILDEATSAVDPETERALTEAMRRLSRGRTTVIIAHRLSTAEAADLVLVFDRGRIVERGRHADLVRTPGGVYAGLYRSWLGNTSAAR
jgi:ATP-binding cassette, subfamily B, bacterial